MTQIYGHRGASGSAPENTIAAFERAVALGVDGVELDVRSTRDRRLVVHHDPVLADGRAIIEIAAVDLPAAVPGLVDVLDVCGPIAVNIEIKNDVADPDFDPADTVAVAVGAVLARRGTGKQYLLSSFNRRTAARCRTLAPNARTALLVETMTNDALLAAVADGHDALHPEHRSLDADWVLAAHRVGIAVNAWTCNDADQIDKLIAWGVDGIVTDYPELAIARRGLTR